MKLIKVIKLNEQEAQLIQQLINQNEAIVALIGRQVFPPEELKKIIMKKKKKPEDYIRIYNLCDGSHSLTEIADKIKISIGTISPILAEWKEIGIIYEIEKSGGKKYYKRLYPLEEPKPMEIEDVKHEENVEIQQSNDRAIG